MEASLLYVAERMVIEDIKDSDQEKYQEPDKKKIDAKIRLINSRLKQRYEISYLQYCLQKKEPKKIKLRQMMWKKAEEGNITMMIWLSKNMLGYTDKLEQVADPAAQPMRLIIEREKPKGE